MWLINHPGWAHFQKSTDCCPCSLEEGTHGEDTCNTLALKDAYAGTLYWPPMTTEIKEYISMRDDCLTHCNGQGKESIPQHKFTVKPWAKVAADLCEFDNKILLAISDYYSNYIKIACLSNLATHAVVKELSKIWCTWHPCCHRQWSAVFLHWVCCIHKDMDVWAQVISSSLSSVQRKSRKCSSYH